MCLLIKRAFRLKPSGFSWLSFLRYAPEHACGVPLQSLTRSVRPCALAHSKITSLRANSQRRRKAHTPKSLTRSVRPCALAHSKITSLRANSQRRRKAHTQKSLTRSVRSCALAHSKITSLRANSQRRRKAHTQKSLTQKKEFYYE